MELSAAKNMLRLRLMREEAAGLSNLGAQLGLLLEGYFADKEQPDPLFAGLNLGGSDKAPDDLTLARLLPDASEDHTYAQLLRMLHERSIIEHHQQNLQLMLGMLNQHLFSDRLLGEDLSRLRDDVFNDSLRRELPEHVTPERHITPLEELTALLESAAFVASFSEEGAAAHADTDTEDTADSAAAQAPKQHAVPSPEQIVGRKRLEQLLQASHPITVIMNQQEALAWVQVATVMRLAIAVKLTYGDFDSLERALVETKEHGHVTVFEWLGMFIDSVSDALIDFKTAERADS